MRFSFPRTQIPGETVDLGLGEVEPEFPPSWDPNPLDLGPGVKEIQVWVREDLVWVQEDVVWVREQRKIPLRPPPPTASRA